MTIITVIAICLPVCTATRLNQKSVHLKEIFIKIHASQKSRLSQVTIYQKCASQIFLDPIQKHTFSIEIVILSRILQLEAVYLEALLN